MRSSEIEDARARALKDPAPLAFEGMRAYRLTLEQRGAWRAENGTVISGVCPHGGTLVGKDKKDCCHYGGDLICESMSVRNALFVAAAANHWVSLLNALEQVCADRLMLLEEVDQRDQMLNDENQTQHEFLSRAHAAEQELAELKAEQRQAKTEAKP